MWCNKCKNIGVKTRFAEFANHVVLAPNCADGFHHRSWLFHAQCDVIA